MARLSSELVLSLTDRVSGPARAIDRNLDNLERRQGRLGRTSKLAAEEVAGLGRAQNRLLAGVASVIPPVAVAAGGQQIVKTAADFETALTNIQKKAGATAAETAKLGEEIKSLATSGDLAVPIEEIAAAYERGAAAGIPLAELREFAALSAKAADAFEMSATDVGNAAAGFKTVQGIPIDKMQRYFDLINGLADAGIADESGIVDYIDQGGAMAKTFGFSAEQTAALGAALANLKVSAAKGATATNSILTRLMAPNALSDDAREAYYSLIKDDKKFQKQLASGKAAEAFVEVVDALKEMDKETRTGTIVELFGQDHLDVMTQIVEGSDELKRNLAFAAGNTWFDSLDKSYALKLDDFWSQWQLAKNSLQKLVIDVGSAGMPALKSALDTAVMLIGEVEAGLKTFKAEVDVGAIDAAMTSVGELKTQVSELLGMKGEDSHIQTFFRDLAGVVSEVAVLVKNVSDEFHDIGAFIRDPIGEMTRERTPEELAEHGITYLQPDEVERQRKVKAERNNRTADEARERGMADFGRGDGLALPPASPPADRMARPRQPDTARFDVDGKPASAELQQSLNALTAALKAKADRTPLDGQLGHTTGEMPVPRARPALPPAGVAAALPAIPIPTLRPDIVGPVTVEGEAAAARATEIGLRISEAFSVTGRPTVDTSGIDAALAKAVALRRELNAIPAAARAASDAAVSARADYSGLHADIEE